MDHRNQTDNQGGKKWSRKYMKQKQDSLVFSARRLELEEIIERGLESFMEVGKALLEIKVNYEYRDTHATFEDYCSERWGFSRQRAYQLLDAHAVSTIVDIQNEGQARELAPLKDRPEQMAEAWKEASASGAPTAAKVKEAVSRHLPPKRRRVKPKAVKPPAPMARPPEADPDKAFRDRIAACVAEIAAIQQDLLGHKLTTNTFQQEHLAEDLTEARRGLLAIRHAVQAEDPPPPPSPRLARIERLPANGWSPDSIVESTAVEVAEDRR